MTRSVLIVGGAPRVRIDAIRYMTVAASGRTAQWLSTALTEAQVANELLLSLDACADDRAQRYEDRDGLDQAVAAWVAQHPEGLVVLSAAINDYQCQQVSETREGRRQPVADGKIPSGADAIHIDLEPAPKLIGNLRHWGFRGHIVAFKYQASESVIAAAQSLQQRSGASVMVANSLDGSVQALVDGADVRPFPDREAVLRALVARIVELCA